MLTISMIIALLSIVQSIFGVGILVFGTPTLLLLGYPLHECLIYLLPASITISALQLMMLRNIPSSIGADFAVWCLPVLLCLLLYKLIATTDISINWIVALMLLVGAFSVVSPKLKVALGKAFKRFSRLYLITMGVVHGISNMGGSMLTIYASATTDGKKEYLKNVALGYISFGLIQFATVAIIYFDKMRLEFLLLPLLSGVTFVLCGRYLLIRLNEVFFRLLLFVVMLSYAMLIVMNQLNYW